MDARTSLAQPSIVKPRQALPIKMTRAAGRATADDCPTNPISDITTGIAAVMKDAGVFGMAMPCVWGGPELDPLTQFRVIEVLAIADSSVGWCAMIGWDGGYVTAYP
jgi:alkylation response protein AidB-like acyl-CoA dehydrogenase